MRKQFTISKISIVWCFSSRADSLYPPKRQLYKNYSQNHFFFKNRFFFVFFFAFLIQKPFEVKENCSKHRLMFAHTNAHI